MTSTRGTQLNLQTFQVSKVSQSETVAVSVFMQSEIVPVSDASTETQSVKEKTIQASMRSRLPLVETIKRRPLKSLGAVVAVAGMLYMFLT